MPSDNLTRNEANLRSKIVKNVKYDIYLDISSAKMPSPLNLTFKSVSKISFDADLNALSLDSSTPLFVDLKASSVNEILINGNKVDVQAFNDHRVQLPTKYIESHNELTIDANCLYTNTGEGLHKYYAENEDEVYLYTQFEVADARRMYACFEQPDIKATFDFTVKAPKGWVLTSTNREISKEEVGECEIWKFATTPIMSTYLTSLCAGPFDVWEDSLTNLDGRKIELRILARHSKAQFLDYDNIFRYTKQGFDFYGKLFNVAYPFEKYDQVFMPQFNAGAMENIGNVTFREGYIFESSVPQWYSERRVTTVLHELAHMWFGDLVTMKWWGDLWLNESFAEFVSTIAGVEATEENRNGYVAFNTYEKSWGMTQDQLPTTHPVAADIKDLNDVLVNFDGITYAKGAAVLQALVHYVGRDNFFKGIENYLNKFAYKNAEFNDLLTELEAVCDRDLMSWANLWLQTAGINTLSTSVKTDIDGVITEFGINQTAPQDYPTLRPHTIKIGFYDFVDDEHISPDVNVTATGQLSLRGAKLQRVSQVQVDVDTCGFTSVDQLVGMNKPALILINDEGMTFAKVVLDQTSVNTALKFAHKIADPLARALVYDSLYYQMRDGHLDPRQYLDMAFKLAAVEDQSVTLRSILSGISTVGYLYFSNSVRKQEIKSIGTNLWELARESRPGSDAQLQFFNTFCEFASTGDHISILQGILKETIVLPSMHVDNLLKWNIIVALARLNAISKAEIISAYEANRNEESKLGMRKAIANIETLEAKEAAFDLVLDKSNVLANAEIEAIGAGFASVIDGDLLSGFIDRYFDNLVSIWNSREFAIAEAIILSFFPLRVASLQLAQAGEKWLDENESCPDALKRLIKEKVDQVRRSLLVQKSSKV